MLLQSLSIIHIFFVQEIYYKNVISDAATVKHQHRPPHVEMFEKHINKNIPKVTALLFHNTPNI